MNNFTSCLTAALTLAFALVAPLQAQIIDPMPEPWVLSPGTATADQAFSLSALNSRYSCASAFANQSVVVADSRIDLSFSSTILPNVLCPAKDMRPYGPTFKMPALKAGKYAVSMHPLLPCHVAPQPCRVAIPVEEAGTLVVDKGGDISYVVSPGSTGANAEFTLSLLSPDFGCNIDYLRTSSRVQDGKITLTFLDKANPLVKCVPVQKMYGPSYKMAALKAGSYEVWAERLPACVEQGCKILPIPVLAGKLVVTGDPIVRKGWFLKQREVKAGTAFDMAVVNNEYGNCNTAFEHTSIVVQDNANKNEANSILVSFVIVNHPERVCIVDIHPHGPTFQVAALKPGRYPLAVQVMPACLYTKPACMVDLMAPVVVDTLIVTQTLSLGEPNAFLVNGPSAWYSNGSLSLQLPEGAKGIWRADLLNLSGRSLQSMPVTAGEGATLDFGLNSKPQRGVYMVRLVSPSRETHTLRVPVRD